ncbi:hypothetical protein ZIOFF_013807 [Zingiber officinale]|uniref:protein-serine/threonine phosphatase n=1 Tax=Zingiber officinale TaxID=94328 RepID=A0A8J5LQV5_ZINOF|nr:hypothetical protein ZIOFF_013807 [Zingiber officinale]
MEVCSSDPQTSSSVMEEGTQSQRASLFASLTNHLLVICPPCVVIPSCCHIWPPPPAKIRPPLDLQGGREVRPQDGEKRKEGGRPHQGRKEGENNRGGYAVGINLYILEATIGTERRNWFWSLFLYKVSIKETTSNGPTQYTLSALRANAQTCYITYKPLDPASTKLAHPTINLPKLYLLIFYRIPLLTSDACAMGSPHDSKRSDRSSNLLPSASCGLLYLLVEGKREKVRAKRRGLGLGARLAIVLRWQMEDHRDRPSAARGRGSRTRRWLLLRLVSGTSEEGEPDGSSTGIMGRYCSAGGSFQWGLRCHFELPAGREFWPLGKTHEKEDEISSLNSNRQASQSMPVTSGDLHNSQEIGMTSTQPALAGGIPRNFFNNPYSDECRLGGNLLTQRYAFLTIFTVALHPPEPAAHSTGDKRGQCVTDNTSSPFAASSLTHNLPLSSVRLRFRSYPREIDRRHVFVNDRNRLTRKPSASESTSRTRRSWDLNVRAVSSPDPSGLTPLRSPALCSSPDPICYLKPMSAGDLTDNVDAKGKPQEEAYDVIVEDSSQEGDVEMEKEEGELEEGEIELGSEPLVVDETTQLSSDIPENEPEKKESDGEELQDISEFDKRISLILEELDTITVEEAETSFEAVCLRLRKSFEDLKPMFTGIESSDTVLLVLVQQAVMAIQTTYSALNSVTMQKKDQNKQLLLRLLIHIKNQYSVLFTLEQVKENLPKFSIPKPIGLGMVLPVSSQPITAKNGGEDVMLHPYVTDALKAVSSYQLKFGSNSILSTDRLPSPTPSEDGGQGDDSTEEVSSSTLNPIDPVGVATNSKKHKTDESVARDHMMKKQRHKLTTSREMETASGSGWSEAKNVIPQPRTAASINSTPLKSKESGLNQPGISLIPSQMASSLTKNLANVLPSSQVVTTSPVVPPCNNQPVASQADQVIVEAASGELNDSETTSLLVSEVGSEKGTRQSANPWGDVDHLFDGYNDEQKATIQKERSRRIAEQNKMFAARKLCLVLDLDHTLLNSAKFIEVDLAHEDILRRKEEQDKEMSQRHLFRFQHMGMWTKLRPGIWNFLEKASNLYELHLYTMGNKLYATEMAKVLDPTGTLFAGRVISKGDDADTFDGDERVPKSKDLDGVLGMESAVVIIDDSVRVWPHNKLNLIVVERYTYFPSSRRQFGLLGPSLLEIDHDERPEDGTLASSLAVIERLHQNFFSHNSLKDVDVRNILAAEQRKILAGCRIVFSRIFPVGEANPHMHPLWQTAEQFGAVCTNQIDEQVTHVVANSLGTDKVNWALSTGRFVVHPGWVEASALLYRRVSEHDFAVKTMIDSSYKTSTQLTLVN